MYNKHMDHAYRIFKYNCRWDTEPHKKVPEACKIASKPERYTNSMRSSVSSNIFRRYGNRGCHPYYA